jgi:Putative Ig domain
MLNIAFRRFCALGSVCLALTACFDGGSNSVTSAASKHFPPSTGTELGTASTNSAPSISGSPATTVAAGTAYSYQPSSQDQDGDSLQYSIAGKPAWATFSVSTGLLTGVPTAEHAGSYENIVISVTDGKGTAALPAFGITVNGGGSSLGSAVLSWQAAVPTGEVPASTDVAGYRLYHGYAADALTQVHQISASDVPRYVFDALVSGTHYFAVTTYTFGGVESALSAILSKTIP